MEQRSDEWFAARCGKVTASCIYKVMARTKAGGYGADRDNYKADLIVERLTGRSVETYTNGAMQWGVDTEAAARDAYSERALCVVKEIGFVDHPRIAWSGASPDGLIGDDGMVEIKCPTPKTHWATLDGSPIERKYLLQMQWQMVCAERAWCDYASFDPRWPGPLQLHVQRVERDDALIAELEGEVAKFLDEVAAAVARGEVLMKEAA